MGNKQLKKHLILHGKRLPYDIKAEKKKKKTNIFRRIYEILALKPPVALLMLS